jgi:hypothetical protein
MSTETKATPKPKTVNTTVDYLPAAEPFKKPYPRETQVEVVRTEAMEFFGVRDRQERDTYRYYLEFEGQRLTDTSIELGALIGEKRRAVHFNLVEEITPGASR